MTTVHQVGAVAGGGGLIENTLNDDRVNAPLREAVENLRGVHAQQQGHGGLQPRIGPDVAVQEHVLQRSQQPSRVIQLAPSDVARVITEFLDELEEEPWSPPAPAQFQ